MKLYVIDKHLVTLQAKMCRRKGSLVITPEKQAQRNTFRTRQLQETSQKEEPTATLTVSHGPSLRKASQMS